jgi:hypothetical protein
MTDTTYPQERTALDKAVEVINQVRRRFLGVAPP